MITEVARILADGFRTAWALRWPFVFSHLLFQLLSAFILAPLVAWLAIQAVRMSGEPALTDFAIAGYLLTPLGLVALVLVASIIIARSVLDIAFMMSIARIDRKKGEASFLDGARHVLPHFTRLVRFSGYLFIRVMVIVTPFALAALFVASRYLSDYDINYYLSFHPLEFWKAVVLIGLILLVLAVIGLPMLAGWTAALPLLLFARVPPAHSFRASRARIGGNRLLVILVLVGWLGVTLALSFVLLGALLWTAEIAASFFGSELKAIAGVLLVFGLAFGLVGTFVTSITTGAIAVIFCQLAEWPEHEGESTREVTTAQRGAGFVAIGIVVVAAGVALSGMWRSEASRSPETVLVIAHRGAAGIRPENTVAAMAKGIEDGADFLELDVQESADDEVIVIHDSDFMKLAGVNLKAWDATIPDLAEIDIGSWFDPAYADERTPTLREILDLSKDRSSVLIELKYYGHDKALEQRVADVVEDTGMVDQVAVMSLKYEAVQKMKALRPDWSVGLLLTAAIGDVWQLQTDFLAVNGAMATPALIASSHEAGKEVYVWTINDAIGMSRMIGLGVDGLITDEPALARDILQQMDALNPLERFVLALSDIMGLQVGTKDYRDVSP